MAMRLNPATGQLEDDGTGSGLTVFPPKPAHERTITTEQRIISPESQRATAQMAVASGAQLNANEQQAGLETAESGVTVAGATDKESEIKRLKLEQAAIAKEQDDHAKASAAADATEAADIAKKNIAKGRANADFWAGNAGGEIFAAVMRGIDRAASSFRGETGPTGVDRIIQAKMEAHERALIAEWEASKEGAESRAKGRAYHAARLAEKRLNATNQSAVELQVIGARVDRGLAALGPERAAAARAQKDAAEMRAAALIEQKRAEGYEELRRATEVSRSPSATGGGGGGGGLTAGQGELSGALTSMTTELAKFKDAKVSQEGLKKWQSNQTAMAGAEKTAGQGVLGSTLVNKLRDFHAIPRKEFEGISAEDEKAILARKRGLDQLSKIMTGAAATDPEVRRREQQWLIQPGDSDEIVADKTKAFMDFISARAIATGAAAPGIQRNIAAVKAAGGLAVPPPPPPPADGETRTYKGKTYQFVGGKPQLVP